jgi:hypothetical protein
VLTEVESLFMWHAKHSHHFEEGPIYAIRADEAYMPYGNIGYFYLTLRKGKVKYQLRHEAATTFYLLAPKQLHFEV